MNRLCLICGRVILSDDKRKRYCSDACANRGRLNRESKKRRETRTADRKLWALHEAQYLNAMVHECGVDCIADYVYNNYKRR